MRAWAVLRSRCGQWDTRSRCLKKTGNWEETECARNHGFPLIWGLILLLNVVTSDEQEKDGIIIAACRPSMENFFEDGFDLDLYEEKDLMRRAGQIGRQCGQALGGIGELSRVWQQQYDIVDEGYFDKGLDNLWEFIRYYGFKRLGSKLTTARYVRIHSRAFLRSAFERDFRIFHQVCRLICQGCSGLHEFDAYHPV